MDMIYDVHCVFRVQVAMAYRYTQHDGIRNEVVRALMSAGF